MQRTLFYSKHLSYVKLKPTGGSWPLMRDTVRFEARSLKQALGTDEMRKSRRPGNAALCEIH